MFPIMKYLINFLNNLHTVSDAHSTTSLWNYFICSYDLHVNIFNLQISDTSPSSDHLSACDVYIDKYNSITHIILKTINTLANVFFWKDVDCKFVASYDYNIINYVHYIIHYFRLIIAIVYCITIGVALRLSFHSVT